MKVATTSVEREALGGEDASGRAVHGRESCARLDDVTVNGQRTDRDVLVDEIEHAEGHSETCDATGGASDDVSRRLGVFGDRRFGSDVTQLGQVFGECRDQEAVDVDGSGSVGSLPPRLVAWSGC